MVGRTVQLKTDQAEALGRLLKPADSRHPWPDQISTHWGRGSKTPIIKVQPRVVVEVADDAALQAGHYRDPLGAARARADLRPSDLVMLGDTTDSG